MNSAEAKKLITALHKVWNLNLLNEIPNIYTEDFVVHWSKVNKESTSFGHDGIRKVIQETLIAFPDWFEDVVDIIAENDRVVTRYVSTGTHSGPYQGIQPTGKKIKVDEISIFRLKENRVDVITLSQIKVIFCKIKLYVLLTLRSYVQSLKEWCIPPNFLIYVLVCTAQST